MLPATIGPVKKTALARVPYVNFVPEDGRMISLQSYFDENERTFKQPFPKDDEIIFLKGTPEQGPYYAKSAVDEGRDIYLNLIDYVTRCCSFPSAMETLLGIERDILNCSAAVEEYFIFLDLFRRKKDALIANLVMTDIEFLFSNIRSLYDSLQILARDVLGHVGKGKSKNLPTSYYDMVKLKDAEMKQKYDLPDSLTDFFSSTRDFFLGCRKVRVGFQHHRIDIPVIFSLDEGFALQKNSPFFSDPLVSTFDIWPEHKVKENGLVSVLALISYLNKTVIVHTDLLSEALDASISSPPQVLKEFRVFFRGPYTHHLLKSREYLELQWMPPIKFQTEQKSGV